MQHLADLALVERSPDPDDGRATLLSLTPDAVTRMAEVVEERRRLLEHRLGDWSDDELGDFVAALARYNRTLE